MESNPVLEAALDYGSRGLRVLPLKPRSKSPAVETGPGHGIATADSAQIHKWFDKHPTRNVGILTGNGLVVVDVDGDEGRETLRQSGAKFPPTLQCKTKRGWHLYYTVDGPVASSTGDGLDISGEGRQVVAPPSTHSSGHVYTWVDPSTPMSPMPRATAEWCNARSGNGQKDAFDGWGDTPEYLIRSLKDRIADRAGEGCETEYEPPTPIQLMEAAEKLPNLDLAWDRWSEDCMAFWEGSRGSDDGLAACLKWSAKSKKFDEQRTRKRWAEITNCPPTEIHFGSIIWKIRQTTDPNFMRKSAPVEVLTTLEKLNKEYCVIGKFGGKSAVMSLVDSGFEDGSKTMMFETFKSFSEYYSNQFVTVKYKDLKGVFHNKKEPLGSYWLKSPDRPSYKGLELYTKATELRTPSGAYNMWRGFGVEAIAGNWKRIKAHITDVLADGDQEAALYILRWCAWAVQHPGERAEVALVLRGGKATGKGAFARIMLRLFGSHGRAIYSSKHFTGNFNAHLRDCLLLFSDEAFWAGDVKGEGTLKGLITERTIPIEQKHFDVKDCPNRLHIIMAANADWVVPASKDERRYAVFDISDKYADDDKYFIPLWGEINGEGPSAMLYDLLRVDLKGWHPRKVVHTEALQKQKEHSLSAFHEWWLHMLIEGELPTEKKAAQQLYDSTKRDFPMLARLSLKKFVTLLRGNGCTYKREENAVYYYFPDLSEAKQRWEMDHGGWKWK